jgi:SAM-dependent methyltransferase
VTLDGNADAESRGPGHRAGPHDAPRQAGAAGLQQAGHSVNAGGLPARTAGLFDRLADRYDSWYDSPAGAAVFASELACLRPLLAGLARPWAEIGAGSGRFAEALGADIGIDPAAGPLALAAGRGIRVVRGAGERLPLRSGVLGAVLIVVTVCFADDPAALLAEARRAVRDDGAVVVGEVFADSAWGRFYQDKAARGHPFYSAARFLTRDQAVALVTAAGLRVQAARSTLCQRPTDSARQEPARDGEAEAAGFVAWRAIPTGPP